MPGRNLTLARSLFGEISAPGPVPLWKFVVPVTVGSAVGAGFAWAARNALDSEHPQTQKTAGAFAHMVGFWLAAGLTWIVLERQSDGAST